MNYWLKTGFGFGSWRAYDFQSVLIPPWILAREEEHEEHEEQEEEEVGTGKVGGPGRVKDLCLIVSVKFQAK